MEFGNFELMFGVYLLIGVALVVYRRRRWRQAMQSLFSPELTKFVFPQAANIARRNLVSHGMLLAILACLVLCLWRPQRGFVWQKVEKRGVDMVIAIDLSESMLARDVEPSRLERAKRELTDLMRLTTGDRLALVAFAGVAFVEVPLTLDYGALRLFLDSLTPALMPIQGTNIEEAVSKSIEVLNSGAGGKGENLSGVAAILDKPKIKNGAILLITDGEDFEGDFDKVRSRLADAGIKLFIVGVGSVEGAPIPLADGFKKDKSGNVVVTRLNQGALQSLAVATGGVYVKSISSDEDIEAVYRVGIKKVMEDTLAANAQARIYNEYYQFPLFVALLLLIVLELYEGDVWRLRARRSEIGSRKLGNWRSGRSSVGSSVDAMLVCLVVFGYGVPEVVLAQSVERRLVPTAENMGHSGREEYGRGNFPESLAEFDSALQKNPSDARLLLGRGSALYRLNKFDEAHEAYKVAAGKTADSSLKAEALYNAGNSLAQLEQYEEAVKVYRESLALAPEDKEVKENLGIVERLLEERKKSEEKGEGDKDQKDQSDGQGKEDEKGDAGDSKSDKQKGQSSDSKSGSENKDDKNSGGDKDKADSESADQDSSDQDGSKQDSPDQNRADKEESQQGKSDKGEDADEGDAGGESKDSANQNSTENSQGDDSQDGDSKDDGASDEAEEASNDKEQGAANAGGASEEGKGTDGKEERKDGTEMSGVIEGVREERGALMEYRKHQALRAARNAKQQLPEKDW